MERRIFEGLLKGDDRTISDLRDTLSHVSLHQREITGIWMGIVGGMQQAAIAGDDECRGRLMDFALWFSNDVKQDDATCLMYGDLAVIYGLPQSNEASVATTRTAATVARVIQRGVDDGQVYVPAGTEKMLIIPDDGGMYLQLAKEAMLVMLENGNFESRKSAAAGLAHLPDNEVRARLISMAREGISGELREAAGESIAVMRNAIELALVVSDRELRLDVEFPDKNDARRECLEQMLDAARTVLETNGKDQDMEYATAVRRLVVFGNKPEDITSAFYTKKEKRILDQMMVHVENALLRVLVRAKDHRLREEAAFGLEKIGSDRLEDILERIERRLGDSRTGKLVSETLETIRGNKIQLEDVKPLPPRPPPRRRRRHSDPNQVLKIFKGR